MSAPSIMLAAPMTGSGKTIVTLGLIRALRRRGLRVSTFKVGPDYIDPAFHARASGRPCRNIDSWAMRFATAVGVLEACGQDAEITVGEGVMGLLDGAPDGTGSTAEVAALFSIPVILVIDTGRMGASVAALADGFIRAREDVDVVGVILNRVASDDHAQTMLDACDARFSTPVLGCLPRDPALDLPSRHLGLVQACEHAGLDQVIERAAAMILQRIDLERIIRCARSPGVSALEPAARPWPPLGQRIAVARDAAFAFMYESVLEGWLRQGAQVLPFSPLAGEAPSPDADAVVLPGGYPELFAAGLAAAIPFHDALRQAAERGAFVYGECGGYMMLGQTLTDAQGRTHRMAGLLPVTTSIAQRKLHLGYRAMTCAVSGALGPAGTRWRGHEFHYTSETSREGPPLFTAQDARGRDRGPQGVALGRVQGSFMHLIDRAAAAG